MFRHLLLACAGALLAASGMAAQAQTEAENGVTEWVVSPAAGLDAILLIGVVSGDVLQKDAYAETIEFVRSRLSPDALGALERLDRALRVERKLLTGPSLAYVFSAGPIDSLDAVIESAGDPDGRLRPALMKTPLWDEQKYEGIRALLPDVALVLRALKDIGFEAWYARDIRPKLDDAVAKIGPALSGYDLIPEQARLLGRPLDPRIELLVVRFSRPYGIRITGQRFVAYYGMEPRDFLLIAAHEIFHPPFDLKDEELLRRLQPLEADPWVQSIVNNHDPAYGYNSFMGVINEDSTQALDQIVSERLGFAREPAKRWQRADGGMHMIAAALYQAMKEDGFADSGGTYGEWLKSALARGLLSPAEVRRRAALIVGEEAVQRWYEAEKP